MRASTSNKSSLFSENQLIITIIVTRCNIVHQNLITIRPNYFPHARFPYNIIPFTFKSIFYIKLSTL